MKIKDAKFATRKWAGYDILTASAGTAKCGGIALLVMENDAFTIENEKVVCPNVISFEMVTGRHKRWFVVGCYLPPSDKEGETQRMVIAALEDRPVGTCPIVVGDLNSDLDFPRDRQEEILSSAMTAQSLTCASNRGTGLGRNDGGRTGYGHSNDTKTAGGGWSVLDSIQARLLPDSEARSTEDQDMQVGVTPPPQLGPPGADSEDWGGAGRGEPLRQGEAEHP